LEPLPLLPWAAAGMGQTNGPTSAPLSAVGAESLAGRYEISCSYWTGPDSKRRLREASPASGGRFFLPPMIFVVDVTTREIRMHLDDAAITLGQSRLHKQQTPTNQNPMKIKTLTLTLALLGCLALPASAIILIPNGDFSDGGANWVNVSGLGDTAPVTFPTGGNPGGYGTITVNGGWGILVSPTAGGAAGGGVPIGNLGLTAGGPVTFTYDSINLSGPGPVGGFKWEAWGNNAIVGNTGDVFPTVIGNGTTWQTYTYNWTLPATTDKLIFVPLWAGGANTSTIGVDNVGVVPEPSTYALLALGAAGLGGHLIRRRRRA
jgi:hypothetical protein